MTCTERERDLALYAGGELETAELEQHLAHCARCREYLQAMSALLTDLGNTTDPATPPVAAVVMQRIRTRRRGWAAFGATVAAACVIAAVLVSWLLRPLPTLSFALRSPAAPIIVVGPERVPPKPMPLRTRHRRSAPHTPAEPIVIKLVTDDPNVIIYWIAD
jgi:hypothetical protein